MHPLQWNRRRALQGSFALGAGAFLPARLCAQTTRNARLTGDISPVHDPCIIKMDGTYYVYCTTMKGDAPGQISCRASQDLVSWKRIGTVFDTIPDSMLHAIPGVTALWAPDISYYAGKYWLYYAGSSFGTNISAIGLATNSTLDPTSSDYRWKDEGIVFQSDLSDNFNCIDPAHVVDLQGKRWLAFGSFWGGIMLMALDSRTGKPANAHPKLTVLAARPTPTGALDAIEACFIIARNGWYYLFASYDYCCKGVNSSYYTAYGRARDVAGPYLDKQGRRLDRGYGTGILKATTRWKGPGHCAVLHDGAGDYIVYHAYDAENNGAPNLRISPIIWDADGWASAEV